MIESESGRLIQSPSTGARQDSKNFFCDNISVNHPSDQLTDPGIKPRAWQKMLSGRRLDIVNPSPDDIDIYDIAHGLSRVSRWNGQTPGDYPFSVAQHSLIVEELLAVTYPDSGDNECLAALLHDAPEYVIGDMITPFKALIGDYYRQIEKRLAGAVCARFGLMIDDKWQLAIKHADRISAYFEAVSLMNFPPDQAGELFGRDYEIPSSLPSRINLMLRPWSSNIAEEKFIDRYKKLVKGD